MARAKKVKLQVTEALIRESLPNAPEGFHYTIDRFSALVWRVWIINEGFFSYTNEPVRSIWGFIKSTGDVIRPRNSQKVSREKVAHITDIPRSMRYTTIVPDLTQLPLAD